jgi:anti-sigma regulatory factor (Ser/Thr protein kinase)
VSGDALRQLELAAGCLRMQIAGDINGLEAGQHTLREFLETNAALARGKYQADIAFEEIVANVIRHAYADFEPGAHPIGVEVTVTDAEIVLRFEDDGPPFDPVAAPERVPPTSIEAAKGGGWGLVLVRRGASRMEYARVADRNRVTICVENR